MVLINSDQVDRATLESALARAISRAYSEDRLLFGDGTKSERSIVFHVGRYLAEIVDSWPGHLVVDAEYGRWYPEEGSVVQKRLGDGPVTPDLIVHERGTRENLLVIEAKVCPTRWSEQADDFVKLGNFMTHESFLYRHAVYLEFHRDLPQRWLWIERPINVDADPTISFTGNLVDVPTY